MTALNHYATGVIYMRGSLAWHAGNDGSGSGLDADLLDGMNATDSRAGNTIVKRQANGYMQAVYVNTTDDASSVSLGWLYGQRSNSDGYHRRFTAASIRDWGGFFTTAKDGSGTGLVSDPSPYTLLTLPTSYHLSFPVVHFQIKKHI